MSEVINKNVMAMLDKTYDFALDGLPTSMSASDLAKEYKEKYGDNLKASHKLKDFQIMKCGSSGFLTGFGGIMTMPITIPANITSVLYVQIRMIAAIACIGGYDVRSDEVQSLVYLCLAGNGINEVAKSAGISFGSKLTTSMIKKIPGSTLIKINQKIGFRFVTKFGQKGIVNLGKMVPLVGGVVGAGFDIASTEIIAKNAIKVFIIGDLD